MNSKVQVECIHSETDVELQERINQFCEQLAKCGNEVMNVSYAIRRQAVLRRRRQAVLRRRRQAVLRRRNQIVLLEQLKTKEDEPLKTIACIR